MTPPAPRTKHPELRLRITLENPPEGVHFAMQVGRCGLSEAVEARADAMVFEFPVNVADATCAPPRLLGEFTQGPVTGRFVYINVGTSAGQIGSPWTRRIKVPLYSMSPELVTKALAKPGTILETRIKGTGRDGTPACATVPLLKPWAPAA